MNTTETLPSLKIITTQVVLPNMPREGETLTETVARTYAAMPAEDLVELIDFEMQCAAERADGHADQVADAIDGCAILAMLHAEAVERRGMTADWERLRDAQIAAAE